MDHERPWLSVVRLSPVALLWPSSGYRLAGDELTEYQGRIKAAGKKVSKAPKPAG
jgi:hypothetical protein